MSLGSNRELAENKLILLYVLDKLNVPVSNRQMTKIILENKFMNYIFLQQFINELCENNNVEANTVEGKTYYTITQSGKQTLSYFINLIPFTTRAKVDETIADARKSIKNEIHVSADYSPESETEFVVNCKVSEDNFTLIDLKLGVGTKSDARTICDNWKSHSQDIYKEIIDILMKKRN